MTNPANPSLDLALETFGSPAAVAHECRVGEQTVRDWIKRGRAPRTAARLLALLLAEMEGLDRDAVERELAGEAA